MFSSPGFFWESISDPLESRSGGQLFRTALKQGACTPKSPAGKRVDQLEVDVALGKKVQVTLPSPLATEEGGLTCSR